MDKEVTLTSEQLNLLEQFLSGFLSYTQSDEFKKHMEEIEEKKKFFQNELPLKLDQLTEPDIEKIVEMLWAFSSTWTNTSYIAKKIIDENGLDKLVDYFKKIYEFKDTPEDAYELFVTFVKRWGPAAITELLAYIYPDKCGIWNKKSQKALEILKIESILTQKYKISKEEYKKLNEILKTIKSKLESQLNKEIDLLFVDVFLYYIVEYHQFEPSKRPKEILEFDHDEIKDIIERIGNILGFDTEIEVNIAPGARVDVIWRAKIGNLGQVKYVFEVHRSGSIDSLILNLQKALLNDPHVQKVIAVSDNYNLKQIEKECEGLPEQFRKVLKLWDVNDVLKTAESLEDAISRIRKLGF